MTKRGTSAGSSGSIVAARSPTWSRAPRRRDPVHKLLSDNPEQYEDAALRHPSFAEPGTGAGCPRRRDQRRQDGHDGRDQRLARAPGRADHARDHGRSRRRARIGYQHRRTFRPPDRAARDAVRRRRRDRRAGARRRPGRAADRPPRPGPISRRAWRAGARAIVLMHGYRHHAHEIALANWRARSDSPRSRSATSSRPDEAGQPRRHGGRRLSVADPAALRRSGRRRARRREVDVHAVERRAGGRPVVSGQGRDPVRAGRRHRRRGAGRGAGRVRADHHLRHGRHVDRCRALCRHLRAHVRGRGQRAAARADDGDPHRRRRRRLDPGVRRRALAGSAPVPPEPGPPATGVAGRSPSPTPTSWSARPALLPECVRAERRSAAGRRDRAPALS